jgi:putative ABC transport system substrate-binding protein
MAAQLVRRRVAVIAAIGSSPPAFAAKAATTTIPVVLLMGEDPVRIGLVASLARPGGNLTGVNLFNSELVAKRLGLLRELVPMANRVALLVDPSDRINADTAIRDVEAAANALGQRVQRVEASSSSEINDAFATFEKDRPDALFITGTPFFNSRRVQLVQWAAHYRIPTTYGSRAYPEIGGLMSYGTYVPETYRQAGLYTGRILRGTKPADLPVMQSSKFELVINAQTARMLGLTVPPTLLATADEVIE